MGKLLKSLHIMGPGSHVGFPISTKNKNFVYDHPMNISAKFDSNLFCCFRKKDENVKFP
jgi:arginine utilization protein RocB